MTLPLDVVLNEDCIAGLAKLPAGSVQLAFADPPFNIGYEYDVYEDRKQADDYLTWCKDWIAGLHRVLADDGTFWLAIGDEFAAELKLIAQREVGFTCRSWVVWYYTFGVNCTKKFSRSHAHLFHFVKNAKQFTFHDTEIRVPSARQLVYGDNRANPAGRLPDDTWIVPPRAIAEAPSPGRVQGEGAASDQTSQHPHPDPLPKGEGGAATFTLRPQDLPGSFRSDEDTWYFPRVAGTFKQRAGWHGCQMPEQLLGRIIRACSNPGDTVLDPFGGSGTTLAVAKKMHRHFLGFELSTEYAANIAKRLESIKPGDDLEGAPEPLVSAPSTANGISVTERQKNRTRYLRKKQKSASNQQPLL